MDDFFEALGEFLSDMFGEVGIWFAPLSAILILAGGFSFWYFLIK